MITKANKSCSNIRISNSRDKTPRKILGSLHAPRLFKSTSNFNLGEGKLSWSSISASIVRHPNLITNQHGSYFKKVTFIRTAAHGVGLPIKNCELKNIVLQVSNWKCNSTRSKHNIFDWRWPFWIVQGSEINFLFYN